MNTASLGSRRSKQNRKAVGSSVQARIQPAETSSTVELSKQTWVIASVSILLVAAILRFYDLNLVPLHHDEGVNGNFLVRLVRDGFYHYDPANYHGPTLYYFAALFPRALRFLSGVPAQDKYGLTTIAVRAVTSLFGLGTVALIFPLRRQLGTLATLCAAGLLAISPGAVYLSRYFIHETIFVFFTLGIVVSLVKYYESRRPVFLIVCGLSAGLLFATKETAIISAVVLVIALVLTHVYQLFWREPATVDIRSKKNKRRESPPPESLVETLRAELQTVFWVVAALAVFFAVNVVFYSSFFTNFPKGVWDALRTFEFWRKTGRQAHIHPFITYFWWLLLQESPVLILGAVGAIFAALKPSKPFLLFSALWSFGLITAYSLIAYKTPWLCLSFIVPLALTSGGAVQAIYEELGEWQLDAPARAGIVALILVMATGLLPGLARALTEKKLHAMTFIPLYQVLDLNFRNYDNDNRYYVYVYAHTRRETLKLVQEIDRIAERTRLGRQTGVTIVSPDYWPLPWYLRDYNRVGYHGRMVTSNEPIVIASQGQAEEVEMTFGNRYQRVHSGFNLAGNFPLRPGVDLLLFTRRELER